MTYRDAGVNIEAGQRLIDRIRPLAEQTHTSEVLAGLGGFAGLCQLPQGVEDPVLVSGTDGVGTKLKLAFEMDRHDTIGRDLVAMCVNDVITTGAKPLFFLDYFATGALNVDQAAEVICGIASGCASAGCALLGGETAEMPQMYAQGEYDLAGFCVGVVSRRALLHPRLVSQGDRLIGLPSTGLHSNGYSLARTALLERGAMALSDPVEDGSRTLGEVLLTPTKIYAPVVRVAHETGLLRGMCHITGGGLIENIPRMLPDGHQARIDESTWKRPWIFDLIAETGSVDHAEMCRTFNMGVGYVFAVQPKDQDTLLKALQDAGETPIELGEVALQREEEPPVQLISDSNLEL
ncbi:MAG: phosphoribosylformylglycinamidine cyclo-ligase [Myxococcota bacterium]